MKRPILVSPFVQGRTSWRQTGGAIDMRRTASLPDDALVTVCGWAVIDTDTNAFANIVSIESATASAGDGIYLQTAADGTTLHWLGVSGGGDVTVGNLLVGQPFFWAITSGGLTAATNIAYLRYFNRGAMSATTLSGTRSAFTPAVLFIGNDSFAEPWNGRFWNIRAWDAVLTPREVLLESFSPVPRAQLDKQHAWWPLEGFGNQLVRDYGPDNKPLTATGTGRVEPFFLPRSAIAFDILTQRAINSAAAGGTTVSAPVSTHSYIGVAPKVSAQVRPAQATHTYTAQTPQVRARVMPAAVTHTYSGLAPGVRASVAPGAATHTYTGVAPNASASVAPAAVTHTYSGRTPTISGASAVAAPAVTHSYVGRVPLVSSTVAPGPATHSYAGVAPAFVSTVRAPVGTHTYAGIAPAVKASVRATVAAHTYVGGVPSILTGNAIASPTVTHTYSGVAPKVSARVAVPFGVHTYSGIAPSFASSLSVPAAAHSYVGRAPQARASVAPPRAIHSYVGAVPGVSAGVTVAAPVGTHTYTAVAPSTTIVFVVRPPVASHTYVARTPTISGVPEIFGQLVNSRVTRSKIRAGTRRSNEQTRRRTNEP